MFGVASLQFLNPKLQEELNRFKGIQMNPQVLLQTLNEMEKQKQRQVELTVSAEMPEVMEKHETIDVVESKKKKKFLCQICGCFIQDLYSHIRCHNKRQLPRSKQDFRSKRSKYHRECLQKTLYGCDGCDKSFLNKRTLGEHLKEHKDENNDNPYDSRNSSFRDRKRRKKHLPRARFPL